jgi:hypothetical protein
MLYHERDSSLVSKSIAKLTALLRCHLVEILGSVSKHRKALARVVQVLSEIESGHANSVEDSYY